MPEYGTRLNDRPGAVNALDPVAIASSSGREFAVVRAVKVREATVAAKPKPAAVTKPARTAGSGQARAASDHPEPDFVRSVFANARN